MIATLGMHHIYWLKRYQHWRVTMYVISNYKFSPHLQVLHIQVVVLRLYHATTVTN